MNDIMIKTQRLCLRLLRQDDIKNLSVLNSDPDVRHFFPDGVQTREQTQARMQDFFIVLSRLWATLFCNI